MSMVCACVLYDMYTQIYDIPTHCTFIITHLSYTSIEYSLHRLQMLLVNAFGLVCVCVCVRCFGLVCVSVCHRVKMHMYIRVVARNRRNFAPRYFSALTRPLWLVSIFDPLALHYRFCVSMSVSMKIK